MAKRVTKQVYQKVIKNNRTVENKEYDFDKIDLSLKESEVPIDDPMKARTTADVVRHLEANPSIGIEARILAFDRKEKDFKTLKVNNRETFINIFNESNRLLRMKEGFASDPFATDGDLTFSNLVGHDFIPTMGGPFNKQLYLQDMQRAMSLGFHAYHHDPFARRIVHTIRDFTLGRGWRSDSEDKQALAWWKAFEQVNDLVRQFNFLSPELSIYGETMLRWIQANATKFGYQLPKDQLPKTGMIPRVRLWDPSSVWDIITYPEDITRVLSYQIVTPTQYQIYTNDQKTGITVPTMKFIYQQVPADDMIHYKINCVSNEKRGRSDLFPVLGYLKRMRDSIQYSIIAMQKASAWGIDTTIQGSQKDIDDYIQEQERLGTFAPAGSEFAHTDKITRNYLSNTAVAKGGNNSSFEWCLSAIAAGSGIPTSYFGTHMSGGQTRASSIVATEPVAKMFEARQNDYICILNQLKRGLFERIGIDPNTEIEFTFPDIITQDRSQKLKDLALAEEQGWIAHDTASQIAAKELSIDTFEYDEEMSRKDQEQDENPAIKVELAPLTAPPAQATQPNAEENPKDFNMTSKDKRDVRMSRGF